MSGGMGIVMVSAAFRLHRASRAGNVPGSLPHIYRIVPGQFIAGKPAFLRLVKSSSRTLSLHYGSLLTSPLKEPVFLRQRQSM